ncbi:hypothetical protein D3C81_1772410 [compost metagenome]
MAGVPQVAALLLVGNNVTLPIAFPCSSLMLLHVVTVPLPATPVETGVAEHHASAARAGKPGLRRPLAVGARVPASGRAATG